MDNAYTIHIFVPDGNSEGLRIIERMNWTGVGVVFSRQQWPDAKSRNEFDKSGVYILIGSGEEESFPNLYIGQADYLRKRVGDQYKEKDFWNWGIVFTSSSGLNRAHIAWLEYALVERAQRVERCHLENGNTPQEPNLSESEKADCEEFLRKILQILPLVGMRSFEKSKTVATPKENLTSSPSTEDQSDVVIVVPAYEDSFRKVFINENCWHQIPISGGMLDKIKYIAGYQTAPISAVTHYAPVEKIEEYGDGSKYKLYFSEPAKEIGPIPFGEALRGSIQGPRYTTLKKLKNAKTLVELFRD